MKAALELAARGRGMTSPNPMVGALVVTGGEVIGRGWHQGPGLPHAEVVALTQARERAKGATIYSTLEPCTVEGRTPPCTGLLIESGLSRVVAAMEDPDRRVSGRGFAALRDSGIAVTEGVLESEAQQLLEAYSVHRRQHRPFVTYKVAASLDAKVAAPDGSSTWITSAEARRDAHLLRAESDAICAGIGTVLADDPALTARDVPLTRPPLRVIVDSSARTPANAKVLSKDAPTLVVTREDAQAKAIEQAAGEVLRVPSDSDRVSIKHMLEALADRGVTSLLLEGGPTLAGAFVSAGLVDKYVLYLAPKLLGESGKPIIQGWTASSLGEARSLEIESVRTVGVDLKVVARPID